MPYGDVKGYIPENDGFKMKMGSKEKFDGSSPFSMKDTALLKTAPLYRELKGNQDELPVELQQAIMDTPEPKKKEGSPLPRNGKDSKDKKIKTEELDNVTVTANSPKTIADNVRHNQERTVRNRLYATTDEEKKDIAQGRFSRSKRDVSDKDYRIYLRNKNKKS